MPVAVNVAVAPPVVCVSVQDTVASTATAAAVMV